VLVLTSTSARHARPLTQCSCRSGYRLSNRHLASLLATQVSRRTDLWTNHVRGANQPAPSLSHRVVSRRSRPGDALDRCRRAGRAAPGGLPCRLRCSTQGSGEHRPRLTARPLRPFCQRRNGASLRRPYGFAERRLSKPQWWSLGDANPDLFHAIAANQGCIRQLESAERFTCGRAEPALSTSIGSQPGSRYVLCHDSERRRHHDNTRLLDLRARAYERTCGPPDGFRVGQERTTTTLPEARPSPT
jgi:hypothetical protein